MKRSSIQAVRRCRYTKSERQEIISGFNACGMTQARYASRHGISPTTLQNWLRARRELQKNEESPKLLPVRILPEGCGSLPARSLDSVFEVTLNSNRQLRIPSGFDPKEVSQLVKILETTC